MFVQFIFVYLVVEVPLLGKSYQIGKPGYERVQWCFRDRLNLTFDLLVAWRPSEGKFKDTGLQNVCDSFTQ